MDQKTKAVKVAIRKRMEKLAALDELLDDPEMAAFVVQALASESKPSAPNPARQERVNDGTPPKRQYRVLPKQALVILRASSEELTAKDIVERLEFGGFPVTAKNKEAAVSKMLRKLAQDGKVSMRRGTGKTSAIRFSALSNSSMRIEQKGPAYVA